MKQEKRLGIKDTLLFGIAGALLIAVPALQWPLFYGVNIDHLLPFEQNVLAIIIAFFVMSFIEHRNESRGKILWNFKFSFALAGALGPAIIYGYHMGISEGLLRFSLLCPIALFSAWAFEKLLAKTTKDES